MLDIISGVVVFGGGGVDLWYFMPTNGNVHPLAKRALLDSLVPITIVNTLAIGTTMIVAGLGIH
jgi:hypothetical protein